MLVVERAQTLALKLNNPQRVLYGRLPDYRLSDPGLKQAGRLALEAGVRTLLINHVSRRYREADIVEEVRSVFPNSYVTRDLDHFMIKRGQGAEKVVVPPRDRAARTDD